MVDVIIVCWNVESLIEDCVRSVLVDPSVSRVILVDNNSSDGTAHVIKSIECELDNVVSVVNSVNLGFGAACNQGSLLVRSEYMLLLNPDTLVDSDTVSKALEIFMSNNAQVLGIQLVDKNGIVHRSCATFPSLYTLLCESTGLSKLSPNLFPSYFMSNWDHRSSRDVDHVIGAFYMIPTSLYKFLDGMDERFFVYYEDVDLSRRVVSIGGRVHYSADVSCFHEGGGSSKSAKAKRTFYSMHGRVKYAYKHLGTFKAVAYLIILLTVERMTRSLVFAIRRDWQSLRETQEAYRMLFSVIARGRIFI